MAAVQARNEAGDQRSQALGLQANEAIRNGDERGAEKLFEQALRGTAEAMRRNPNDPRRIFDHAQNVFYVGELALKRGDERAAERYMIEYSRLAGRLVELEPSNLKWRREVQYADTNLGVLLVQQRRFDEAATRIDDVVQQTKVLANAAPRDRGRQQDVGQAIAWLADARFGGGRINDTVSLREQHVAILNSLSSQSSGDADYQMSLTNAQLALGSAYAAAGKSDLALERFRAAVANADRSIPLDNASNWYRTAIHARLTLAAFTLSAGNRTEAATETHSACTLADKLQGQSREDSAWRRERRDCWLMRTRVALYARRNFEAVTDAQRAVGLSKMTVGGDHAADSFRMATAYRLLGDAQITSRNATAAQDAWSKALTAMSAQTQTPPEMDEHARILQRMRRLSEAAEIESRLKRIGYHRQK